MVDDKEDAWLLIHGTIQNRNYNIGKNIPHAWLLSSDTSICWEPITQDVLPVDIFISLYTAREEYRYDLAAAIIHILNQDTAGPWEGAYWIQDKEGRIYPNG
jgi:hypothetical protein